jgi:hypothetical protein
MKSHDHFRMGRFSGAPPWVLHLLFNFRFSFKALISKISLFSGAQRFAIKALCSAKRGRAKSPAPQGYLANDSAI